MTKLNMLAQSESRRKNPRAYPCDQCDASYTTNQRLKFHVMRIHEKKSFNCPQCGLKLATPDTLRNHIRAVHEGIQPRDYRKINEQRKINREKKREMLALTTATQN